MYPPVESSHGEIYISNIRTNIGRSTGGPPVESSSGEEWQFYISIIKAILAEQLADLPPADSSHGEFYICSLKASTG